MARYVILPGAQEDLEQINSFTVRNWGVRQADDYLKELIATFKLIALQPSVGRDRSEDIGLGYMSFSHKSHAIYYKKTAEGVAIAAILHHNMIPQRHLQKRTVNLTDT